MHLPVLLLAFIGFSVAYDPSSSEHERFRRQTSEEMDAIEIGVTFFLKLRSAIKSGDVFRVLKFISPQNGNSNIDASKLIQQLTGFSPGFREGHFVNGNRNEVSLSLIFRPTRVEYPIKTGIFVLEHGVETHPITGNWTMKSMTELATIYGSKN